MEDDGDDNSLFFRRGDSYNRNNKIIIVAITTLSLVVTLLTVLHIYVRCVLRREARRRAALRHLRFNIATSQVPSRMGLDPAVIASLPILVFKRAGRQIGDDETGVLKECTVCLCIFKDGERIRVLPNCNHRFHAECIDKWLSSTSTCPICRTKAEPQHITPEAREPMVTAPLIMPQLPRERVSSVALGSEGASDDSLQPSAAKVDGSNSRLSSFHRILNRERSSARRVQSCGEDVVEDVVLHV